MMLKIITLILFSGLATGCTDNNNSREDMTFVLEKSFQDIYLAKHGKEYPYTERRLKTCKQYNDKRCLRTFDIVRQARDTIVSLPSAEALQATLAIIPAACSSEDENIANFTCYGGIMSLYFYNSSEQDAIILATIKNYPKKIQGLIFNYYFAWYHNRPNPRLWIDYLSVADIDWEHDNQKPFISELFGRKLDQEEKTSGLLLRY